MIYTFYSFKGGVGRSMAMANVAYELAGRGLRVLAIDFDLEAPGLERYFKVPVPSVHATRGVIDLIDAYKKALAGSGSIDESAEFRQLREHYIHPIAEFGRGRLDLLPAGRRLSAEDRRAYSLAVRTFDWQDFYFNWEGEAFFEWLRRTLSGHADKAGLYDVVLADSRTGVTEMGGVCACQLADVVVMLSAPNYQNIEGTRELARDLDSPAVRELRRQRELGIVVVPARVEQRAPERLPDFIRRFDEAFSEYLPREFAALGLHFHDLALPYVPDYAFEEQVTDRHGPEGAGLDSAYKRLCDAMLVLSQQPSLADARAAAEQTLRPAAATGSPEPPAATERAYDATQRYAGVDAYLSCGRGERPLVEELAAALSAPGSDLRTLTSEAAAYGSERDLPASTAELLNHAQALVLFAGPSGVSPWQREELKLARSLPRAPRVVQVLLHGAADDAFELAFGSTLRDSPLIDLRAWPEDSRAFTLLADALRGTRQVAEAPMARPDDAQPPPFPGHPPYGEGDALAFFGRTAEIESLSRQVLTERRLVLRGPSGCGKTSLVRAGLFPALRHSAADLKLSYFDLLQQPVAVAELAAATMPADSLLVIDHAGIGDEAQLQAIVQIWQRSDGPRLLLVWRDCPLAGTATEAARRWKAATEAAGRQREHPVHRECPFGPAAGALLAATAAAPGLTLAALDAAALRAAVEAALAGAGRRAEAGLLDRLFADAGPLPATAVVQRVLARLWTMQVRGFLTNEAYGRDAGIDGAFVAAIEARRSDRDAEPDAIQALLLRLLRVADDGSLQRRALSWCREGSQPALTVSSVERLARAGLVTVTRSGPDVTLQLAHLPRSEAWPQAKALHAADTVAPDMLRIADAYARWIDGEDSDEVDSVLDRTPFSALAPRMSFGESCFVFNERRRLKRQRYLQMALGSVVLALIVGGVLFGNEQRQVAASAESAASAAGVAQRELAVAAARATENLALRTPYGDPPDNAKPSPAAGRTRAVLHTSGGGPVDRRVAQALAQLLASNYAVDDRVEPVSQQVCGDVRFHQPQDRAAAEQALQVVNGWLTQARDPRRLQLNDRSYSRAALPSTAGTIEIWLPPFSEQAPQVQDDYGVWRLVTAGCAVLGSDQQSRDALRKGLNAPDAAHYASELPLERQWLAEFYIQRTEVTMAQFDRYQKACKACPPWQPRYVDAKSEPDRPAVFVSWEQAKAYCESAGGRLPSDREWEKAARGPEGRFWSWGDKPDDSKFQGAAQTLRRPVAVGSFPTGDSPYGVADMAGNVWEFTSSPWRERDSAYTIRGGSYLNSLMESRASVRWATNSQASGAEFLGFRCVRESMR